MSAWSRWQGVNGGLQGVNGGLQGVHGALQGVQGLGFGSPAEGLTPGADPAFSYGLVLSREANMQSRGSEPIDFKLPGAFRDPLDADGLPAVDQPSRLDQWSAEIRYENLMAELIRPLHLSACPDTRSVTVRHVHPEDPLPLCTPLDGAAPTGAVALLPIYQVVRPARKVFEAQLPLVLTWADLRAERMQELITQIGIPLQYWSAVLDLNPTTYRHTLELLVLGLGLMSYLNQPTKHLLACPRPVDYSPSVQPVINARRFAAFPSGHASEAFVVARLLSTLAKSDKGFPQDPVAAGQMDKQLQRLATRISNNRVVAGVHFPIDGTAGRMVGETTAEYLLHRCGALADGWMPRIFDGAALTVESAEVVNGFNPDAKLDQPDDAPAAPFQRNTLERQVVPGGSLVAGVQEGLLHRLWRQAQAEWSHEMHCA